MFDSLQTRGLYGLPGFSVHGIFQARILEWVANFLLLGIFSTQGLNLDHQHCRQILYCLSQKFFLPLMLHSIVKIFIFDSCIPPKLIHCLLLLIQMWGPAFPILYIPLSVTTLYLCMFVSYSCNPLLCTVK